MNLALRNAYRRYRKNNANQLFVLKYPDHGPVDSALARDILDNTRNGGMILMPRSCEMEVVDNWLTHFWSAKMAERNRK